MTVQPAIASPIELRNSDELSTSRVAAIATAVALGALVLLAVWLRFQLIVIYGGLEPSYLEWAQTNYFGGISSFYVHAAQMMRAFEPYPSMAYPPGYAAFLALLQTIGFEDLQRLRHAQATLDAFAVLLVFALCRELGMGRIWSVCAAAFYATYLPLVAGAGLLVAEALSPSLLLLSLWMTVWAVRAPTERRLAALGAALSLIAMIRPDLALMIGFLGVWLWTFGRVPWRPRLMGAYLGAFLLVTLPWGIHNRVAHGAWVFTSTGGSAGLWEGLGEIPNSYGYILGDDVTSRMLQSKGFAWHSVEADRYLRQDYLRAWTEHPDFVVRVIIKRWQQILTESEIFQIPAFQLLKQALDTWGVYVWGLAILVGARRRMTWLILAIPCVYALFSIGLVHYEPRYVRYVHIVFAIAPLFLASVLCELLRRRVRFVGAIVAFAVAVFLATRAWPEIAIVKTQSRELQVQKLIENPTERAKLRLLAGQNDDRWVIDPGATVAPTGSTLRVASPDAYTGYLLTKTFDLPATELVALSYDLTLSEGNVTVGILDATDHWLKTINFATPGTHRGHLAAQWPGGTRVAVVIAAANDHPASTAFELGEASLRILPGAAARQP